MPPETPLPNEAAARTETGEIKDAQATPTPTPAEAATTESSTPAASSTTESKSSEQPEASATTESSLLNKEEKVAEGAPESYKDFTVPEGFEIPEESSKEINALFKDLNLSQEAGQKLVDFYAKNAIEARQAPEKLWESTRQDWVNAVAADKELGDLKNVKTSIGRMLDTLGDAQLVKSFREAMDITGAGDNPAFIKTFFRLSQRLGEGTNVVGKGPSPHGQQAPDARPATGAKALYPNLP